MRRVILLVAALLGACGSDGCPEARGVAGGAAGGFEIPSCTLGSEPCTCRITGTDCELRSSDAVVDLAGVARLAGVSVSNEGASGTSCEPSAVIVGDDGSSAVVRAINAGDRWDWTMEVDRADGSTCCFMGWLE